MIMIVSDHIKENEIDEVTEEVTECNMFYPSVDTTEGVTNNIIICFCNN